MQVHGKRYAYKFDFTGLAQAMQPSACDASTSSNGSNPPAAVPFSLSTPFASTSASASSALCFPHKSATKRPREAVSPGNDFDSPRGAPKEPACGGYASTTPSHRFLAAAAAAACFFPEVQGHHGPTNQSMGVCYDAPQHQQPHETYMQQYGGEGTNAFAMMAGYNVDSLTNGGGGCGSSNHVTVAAPGQGRN